MVGWMYWREADWVCLNMTSRLFNSTAVNLWKLSANAMLPVVSHSCFIAVARHCLTDTCDDHLQDKSSPLSQQHFSFVNFRVSTYPTCIHLLPSIPLDSFTGKQNMYDKQWVKMSVNIFILFSLRCDFLRPMHHCLETLLFFFQCHFWRYCNLLCFLLIFMKNKLAN